MQSTAQDRLRQFRNLLQAELFPWLESSVGAMGKPARLLAAVLSREPLARWLGRRARTGRRPCDRQLLATAFFAKAIYNLPTARHLMQRLQTDTQLRRLCGWDTAQQIPTEATFSRAFAEFAAAGLPGKIHAALIRNTQQDRVIEHIARDSTAIEARQRLPADRDKKRLPKPSPFPKYKTRTGLHQRRKRGPHPRAKACQRGPRLARQAHMTLPEMRADLPQERSLGVKTSSQGHQHYWRGFKLHWDVADAGRIPINCLLTGAGVHDSQAAIPLMPMSAGRVRWHCDIMDSAYDARAIRQQSRKLGHQALINPSGAPINPTTGRMN